MSNIQGRVKHKILEELFEVGHLPNPDTLTTEIQSALDKFNNGLKPKTTEVTFFSGLLKGKSSPTKHYRLYGKPSDFIRDLRSGKLDKYPVKEDKLYLLDLWNKIQDIRCALEVRCVAKNSQSNNVYADRNTLLAIKRVIENKEDYLKL